MAPERESLPIGTIQHPGANSNPALSLSIWKPTLVGQIAYGTRVLRWHTPGAMAVDTKTVSVRMGNQGRIVIPAELRQALGIVSGEKLVARVENGRLILETKESITASLQKLFMDAVPAGVSLADELIAERRAEARREEEAS